MKEVLVLQHEACEDLGRIKVALKARGLVPRYVRLFAGESIPSALESAEALIVMGGPMSVYEQEQYPFLTAELELIHRTISSGRPILGVCLGSQLLSAALGGAVSKGERKEIGWYPVRLSNQASSDPLLLGVPEEFVGFHWHGDVFTLPPGAESLASSAVTEHQAFRYGWNAYGLLFHLEVTRESIHAMTQKFVDELQQAGGTAAQIEADTGKHLSTLDGIADKVFERWTALVPLVNSGGPDGAFCT